MSRITSFNHILLSIQFCPDWWISNYISLTNVTTCLNEYYWRAHSLLDSLRHLKMNQIAYSIFISKQHRQWQQSAMNMYQNWISARSSYDHGENVLRWGKIIKGNNLEWLYLELEISCLSLLWIRSILHKKYLSGFRFDVLQACDAWTMHGYGKSEELWRQVGDINFSSSCWVSQEKTSPKWSTHFAAPSNERISVI